MEDLVCVGITHKEAEVEELEKARFESDEAVKDIVESLGLSGCVLLQTCNRVEVYASGAGDRAEELRDLVHDDSWVKRGLEAVRHLFRVACGLESMMVGEQEILRQVKEAYDHAARLGTLDDVLKTVFRRAISLGKRAREETRISEGAVSIGSAAVELAERELGSLHDKTVLVVGAGEMGKTVAKSLVNRGVRAVFVANRTYERAVELSRDLGGEAVRFDELVDYLARSDVVVSATAAPHPVIHVDDVREALRKRDRRSPILIIDIANPRDVEKGVEKLEGVEVRTIDDLRVIAEENLERRRKEIPKVEKLIEEELSIVEEELEKLKERRLVADVARVLHGIKDRELERALRRLKVGDSEDVLRDFAEAYTKRLINVLTSAIMELPDEYRRMTCRALRRASELNG
ncbi:glutamyl-tRNA reductase [Methanopyrus sp.]